MKRLQYTNIFALIIGIVLILGGTIAYGVIPAIRANGLQLSLNAATPIGASVAGIWGKSGSNGKPFWTDTSGTDDAICTATSTTTLTNKTITSPTFSGATTFLANTNTSLSAATEGSGFAAQVLGAPQDTGTNPAVILKANVALSTSDHIVDIMNGATVKAYINDSGYLVTTGSAAGLFNNSLSSFDGILASSGGVFLKVGGSTTFETSSGLIENHVTSLFDQGFRVTPTAIKTGTYTILSTDTLVRTDVSGGGFTVTLPATGVNGQVFIVTQESSSTNNLTISANSGNTIDGSSTKVVATAHSSTRIYGGSSTTYFTF